MQTCYNCGVEITKPVYGLSTKKVFCSTKCREDFEEDHFEEDFEPDEFIDMNDDYDDY